MKMALETLRPTLPIAVLSVVAFSASAQGPIQPRSAPGPKQPAVPNVNLRVDTSLVLVPVTVNDELNHPVTGLEKENFRIFDDKREQTITTFSTEDEPIVLGLVFDVSGSVELRNRYVIGYAPQDATRDGRYHHVEVRLVPPRGLPKLRAHWRVGYYALGD
jgi:hypothetical protein